MNNDTVKKVICYYLFEAVDLDPDMILYFTQTGLTSESPFSGCFKTLHNPSKGVLIQEEVLTSSHDSLRGQMDGRTGGQTDGHMGG